MRTSSSDAPVRARRSRRGAVLLVVALVVVALLSSVVRPYAAMMVAVVAWFSPRVSLWVRVAVIACCLALAVVTLLSQAADPTFTYPPGMEP